jgi:hypothetical protein
MGGKAMILPRNYPLDNEPGEVNEPKCDICGRAADDSPAGFADADWNGETGNHETCEEWDRVMKAGHS